MNTAQYMYAFIKENSIFRFHMYYIQVYKYKINQSRRYII